MKKFLVTLLMLVFFSVPASAKFEEPLSEWLKNQQDTEENVDYLSKRCAGLFISIQIVLANSENEQLKRSIFMRANFILEALIASYTKRTGKTPEEVIKNISTSIIPFKNDYLQRMRSNYEMTGKAFAEDVLIIDDLSLCSQYADYVRNELYKKKPIPFDQALTE